MQILSLYSQTCPTFEGVLDKTQPQLGTQAMKMTLKYDHCLVWDHTELGQVQTFDKSKVLQTGKPPGWESCGKLLRYQLRGDVNTQTEVRRETWNSTYQLCDLTELSKPQADPLCTGLTIVPNMQRFQ